MSLSPAPTLNPTNGQAFPCAETSFGFMKCVLSAPYNRNLSRSTAERQGDFKLAKVNIRRRTYLRRYLYRCRLGLSSVGGGSYGIEFGLRIGEEGRLEDRKLRGILRMSRRGGWFLRKGDQGCDFEGSFDSRDMASEYFPWEKISTLLSPDTSPLA
jgi:hypothetical protein